MANYFRITAYQPDEDLSVIMDSNGMFEHIWQFSSYLVKKGFRVLKVGDTNKFRDGNIELAPESSDKVMLRAYSKGKPLYEGNTVKVGNKFYEVIK